MEQAIKERETRRSFILKSGAYLGAAVLFGAVPALGAEKGVREAVEVTPTEDLMKEHGVLHRLLLIYEEIGGRLQRGTSFPLEVLQKNTDLIRRFIQDYHEKDEEEYLFKRFDQAGKMVDLVKVLLQQHEAGRQLIAQLQNLTTPDNLQIPAARTQTVEYLQSFTRMYRPHAAREDTVLYPAFRSVISPKEFMELGETFENREEKFFGKEGFEKIVAQVVDLEKSLGIYELSQFTPKLATGKAEAST